MREFRFPKLTERDRESGTMGNGVIMGKRERENSGGVMRESGTRGVKSRNEFREIQR